MICARLEALLEEYTGEPLPITEVRRTRQACGCDACSREYTTRQVRHVVDLMLQTDGDTNTPSPEGFRLELARYGLLGKRALDEWARYSASERRQIRRALLVWVKERLSPELRTVLRLAHEAVGAKDGVARYVPVGKLRRLGVPIEESDGQVDEHGRPRVFACGARLKNGRTCQRAREAGESRCKQHFDPRSRPHVWVTDEGETLVEICDDGRTALVRGAQAVKRDHAQIGRDMAAAGFAPLTERQVRRRISEAYALLRCMPEVGLLTETRRET